MFCNTVRFRSVYTIGHPDAGRLMYGAAHSSRLLTSTPSSASASSTDSSVLSSHSNGSSSHNHNSRGQTAMRTFARKSSLPTGADPDCGNWTLRRGQSFAGGPGVQTSPVPVPPPPMVTGRYNTLGGRRPVVCSLDNVGSLQRVKRVYI